MSESECRATSTRHLWQIAWVRDLFWLSMLLTGLVLVWYLRAVTQPVVLALLFAYLINPLFVHCERRWTIPRLVAISVFFLAAAGVIAGVSLAIAPVAVSQTAEFVSKMPDYVDSVARRMGVNDEAALEEVRQQGAVFMDDPVSILSYLWDGFVTSFGVLRGVMGTAASLAVGLTLFPVCLFYFSWRFPKIVEWPVPFIPASRRERVCEIARMMDQAVGGYFRTRLMIALIMGAMYSTGWGIAGVPYWLLVGLLAGLLGIIPYAAGIAWFGAVLLSLLEMDTDAISAGDIIQAVVWPTLVFAVVQASDDWVLSPWLQGRELNLSFLAIMLAVLVGGALAGILGMLMAVPTAACIRILWVEVFRPRLTTLAEAH